jgi:hypothetical protein
MQNAFSAGFSTSDYNNGGCVGGLKGAKFMQSPFVKKSSHTIEVDNVGASVNANACLYQDTQESCSFSVGGDGLT